MESISNILRETEFRFNKQFGQNFITDSNLLDAMVADSGITNNDTVVEIGAGAGTLTLSLAKIAKKVITFEIDDNLRPVLDRTLKGMDDKVEVIFKDIMKVKDSDLNEIVGEKFKLVANLPYYITTPIIMRFLECEIKPESISVMVQKEVAERFVAKPNTPEYGAITAVINLYSNARITRIVRKEMFFPQPKVDSAVIRFDIDDNKYNCDKEKVKKVIKYAFAMRRKTLVNNLLSNTDLKREQIENILLDMGLNAKIRGEALSTDEFINLADKIYI